MIFFKEVKKAFLVKRKKSYQTCTKAEYNNFLLIYSSSFNNFFIKVSN